MALGYGRTATNNFAVAKFIVDTNGIQNGATHSTISSAIADSVSGDNIHVKPGTYTENFTIPAGVNVMAYASDGFNGQVEVVGTVTMNTAGTASIQGIRITTNSAFGIVNSGSVASVLNVLNCDLNATNNTFISHTSSSSSSTISLNNCSGDIGTTGIAFYTKTSPGVLNNSGS